SAHAARASVRDRGERALLREGRGDDRARGAMSADVDRPSTDRIRAIARAPALGVLVDLDGTLIPLAQTPGQAHAGAEVAQVLTELASAPGTRVVVISGRPRSSLEERVGELPVW